MSLVHLSASARWQQKNIRHAELQTHEPPQRRAAGFSLIELMIVVAVILIIAALAIPQSVARANGGK